ncbi:glycosyltransferase involved in cell wall biosynthesis [Mucilaginibacter oryzae]|uniref:Glycosyltransferase involved in cell wall biosynthesis n=1 Tax=Mucilaginibacter oryzae TaxID=468058 RepID=A0A316H1V7_9SPHI|nr:glycosyltransferase [Mucilaginibacter oryzae]PWK71423.1 glycosyltransferase involved in cell wall biosynthesis [Mucilaginibacter oryzae]
MDKFNLCIIKPNKSAFSETFIQAHVDRIQANKKVLYGGAFPLCDDAGKFIIKSKIGLLSYLIQKRIFKKQEIGVRTRALAQYLKFNKIDVVLAEYGMVGAMVSGACKLADVPLVIHFHGADAHHKPTVSAYNELYRKAFSYCSAIVAVSQDMIEALITLGAPAEKIVLNPYGVDAAKFPQIDISQSPVNFLSVGRFVEKKSPASIVLAFKMVHENYPQARLWMVGEGPLFNDVEVLVKQLNLTDYVTLTGVLTADGINKLMQNMRCFVQHSVTAADGDMEGTPNTILEAGSAGLAIVSTKHAGIKEAVINGKTGYLVDEHDIKGMAGYMIKIASDVNLAAGLGKKEAAHIRKNYDINDRIEKLTIILKQSIKKH